jgi:hypothetical protein
MIHGKLGYETSGSLESAERTALVPGVGVEIMPLLEIDYVYAAFGVAAQPSIITEHYSRNLPPSHTSHKS